MIYTDKVHLIADSIDELHEFAKEIGLKREWFQDNEKHPHYDIWGVMVKRAIKKGAIVVSSKEIIQIFKNK